MSGMPTITPAVRPAAPADIPAVERLLIGSGLPLDGVREVTRDAVPDDIRATAEFRSACPASAIVMRRDLTDAPGPA